MTMQALTAREKTVRFTLLLISALLMWCITFLKLYYSDWLYLPDSLTFMFPLGLFWWTGLFEYFGNGSVIFFGTVYIPVLFMLWSYQLVKGDNVIPKRSKILTLILVFVSLLWLVPWLVAIWAGGARHQGLGPTNAALMVNVLCWFVLFMLYRASMKYKLYIQNYLFHWLLFAWLGWFAFPWFGESL